MKLSRFICLSALCSVFAGFPGAAYAGSALSDLDFSNKAASIAVPVIAENTAAGTELTPISPEDQKLLDAEIYPDDASRAPAMDYSGLVNREKTNPPLVVVVHGLEFGQVGFILELRHIQWFINFIKNRSPLVAEGVTVDSATKFLSDNTVLESRTSRHPGHEGDYMVDLMEKVKTIAGVNAEIVKLGWSHDPEDTTQTVKRFKTQLIALHRRAVDEKRPLYVMGFSWGSVLLYEALQDFNTARQPFYADKFVTMGSPLVPQGFLVKIFVAIETIKERLHAKVRKPKNVGFWVNLYSGYDECAGFIKAADKNYATHFPAVPVIEKLEKMKSTPDVEEDLKKMKRTHFWHMSYFCNFEVQLASLGYTYYQELVNTYSYVYLP